MAEDVECDTCGEIGWRRRWTIAPKGWFYATFFYEDDIQNDNEFYVYACSEECKDIRWKQGPGSLVKI